MAQKTDFGKLSHKFKTVTELDPLNYHPIGVKPYQFQILADKCCFTNPISCVEQSTYPYPTPSAIAGALGAVYSHPPFMWDVLKIEIMKHAEHVDCALKIKGSPIHADPKNDGLYIHGDTSKKAIQIVHTSSLVNVEYRVTARPLYWKEAYLAIGCNIKPDECAEKHIKILERRFGFNGQQGGQTYHTPYLGHREDTCIILPASEEFLARTPVDENADYESVHHVLRNNSRHFCRAFYYRCVCNHGVIEVPSLLDSYKYHRFGEHE